MTVVYNDKQDLSSALLSEELQVSVSGRMGNHVFILKCLILQAWKRQPDLHHDYEALLRQLRRRLIALNPDCVSCTITSCGKSIRFDK